jgi:ParB family chromosome partitioning protein
MTTNLRKNFGSGLEAVLGAVGTEFIEPENNGKELKMVMVHQLSPGKYQPRRDFDQAALQELSDSIASQGILQPIVVRRSGNGEYEIIAGERRWRAAQMAGLQQVPVIICDISDESALAFGLIENIQRQDLNPIEEAFALKRLIEEFKMTHEQVAKSVGRSRAAVSNMLRLLNLAKPVQELLISKQLDVGHAKLLLVFSFDEQLNIANHIINKKLTVRAAEKFVNSRKTGSDGKSINQVHPSCEQWSRELSRKLSAKADVKLNQFGTGKITIQVESSQEVEWLIENL